MPNKATVTLDGEISGLQAKLNQVEAQVDRIISKAGNINLGGRVSSGLGGSSVPGTGYHGGASSGAIRSASVSSGVALTGGARGISGVAGVPASSAVGFGYGGSIGGVLQTYTFDPNQTQSFPAPQNASSQQLPWWMASPRSMVSSAGRGLLLTAGMAASDYVSAQTQQILTGHPDIMRNARSQGEVIGGVFGAILGAPFGPFGGMVGAGALGHIGGSVAEWLVAPQVNRVSATSAQLSIGGSLHSGKLGWANSYQRTHRFDEMIEKGPWESGSDLRGAPPHLATTWASVSSGLMAGGVDPEGRAGTGYYYNPGRDDIAAGREIMGRARSARTLIRGIEAVATGLIKQTGRGAEQIGEMYTRRLYNLFGSGEDKIVAEEGKRVAPIFGSLPETGNNIADILAKFGPQATSTYLRIQNESLVGSVSPTDLMQSSAGIRSAERKALLGSLQARGVGKALTSAYDRELGVIATLPGGTDSVAYKETFQKLRRATMQNFDESDTIEFGIPEAHLRGLEERQRFMPFAPGFNAAVQLQGMKLRARQLAVMQGRFSSLKAGGLLSESEELNWVERMESVQTKQAQSVGMLSEGALDRLPSMVAGRLSGTSRFDSTALAAANLAQMGSPIRRFGAVSGRQARMDDEFVRQFAGSPMNPVGATSLLDSGEGLRSLKAIELILRQMLMGQSKNSQFSRPGNNLDPSGGMLPDAMGGSSG